MSVLGSSGSAKQSPCAMYVRPYTTSSGSGAVLRGVQGGSTGLGRGR